MWDYAWYAAWAFAAGVVIPIMATFNAQLGRSIENPPASVVVLTMVACCTALCYLLAARTGFPTIGALSAAPRYTLGAGMLVAFYMISVTLLIPKFGVGNTILFVVCAQMFSSALIDNYGLFGVAERPISFMRIAGLAVMIVGLVLVQLGATAPKA